MITAAQRWFRARPYLHALRVRPELGFATLFDPAYYRTQYRGPLPPLLHFIVVGAFTGHDPHPLFDTAFYLRKYPDVAASGVNPLFHYLLHGAAEGRKPHPLFEPEYYSAQCADGPPAQPLLHFLSSGRDSRAQPHPLFDGRGYWRGQSNPSSDPRLRDPNPLMDFVHRGPGPVGEGVQYGQAPVAGQAGATPEDGG